MRVLFVAHNAALYGASRSLINLIEGLHIYNIKPLVLCPEEGELTDYFKINGISYIIKKFDNWIYIKQLGFLKLPIKIIRTILFGRSVLPSLRKFDPDIIYSNSSVVFVGAILSWILKKPHLWHIREYGKLDYNIKFHFGEAGLRYLLNKSSAIIAISKSIDEQILQNIKTQKYIVYNGVIWEKELTETNRYLDKKKEITFGIIGLLVSGKNQLEAIKAFNIFHSKHPNSKLLIIGDSNDKKYKSNLLKEVRMLRLDKAILFLGYIANMEEMFSQIDVLLMCSKSEGMGRVTVEALARGIPVIGFDAGATPEIVHDGINGFLYKGNHVDLERKMDILFKEPGLYKMFSDMAIGSIKKEFTIEKYAERVYEIIKRIKNSHQVNSHPSWI